MIHYEDMTKEQVIKILKDTLEYAEKQDAEVERLNNIINELEEYICAIEYDESNYNETWQIAVRIHNKLKELKGDSSND